MRDYPKTEVETIDELRKMIDTACCVKEMDNLRWATVRFMSDGHPEILKLWQDKYWALKNCPTCGKPIN